MCKQILKVQEKLIPWQDFGAGLPQLHPIIIDLHIPPYINFQLLQQEGNRFFELLSFEMSNEEKAVIIKRHLQIFINRRYGY